MAANHQAARRGVVMAAFLALGLSACAGSSDGAVPRTSASSTPTAASSSGAAVDPAETPSLDGLFPVADGGRRLKLVCWGDGAPTVLLETGGNNIEEWTGTSVVRQLASRTRVCTYDRAGTGGSDPAPDVRRDASDVVADIDDLLEAAQLSGPLVLLGRSFGGMVVTHYADVRPRDVVGVVVFDTPAPSADFTEKSEPGLVWDAPGNVEHLDVVTGFENRFAHHPPHVDVPLLLITPVDGEASVEDESFWLQTSAQAEQVQLACEDTEGPCTDRIVGFVEGLDTTAG